MAIQIEPLTKHFGAIPALTLAYEREWPEWYGPNGPGNALKDLTDRAKGEELPLGLVAVENGYAIGTVGLAERSIQSHAHLSPWIVGLLVEPGARGRGVGSQLVAATVQLAAELGYPQLWVATQEATGLFRRPDWALHEVVEEGGRRLAVFVADLPTLPHPGASR